MACQLGGWEGYKIVEQADLKGVNPGSDTLSELLFQFGPCLIIMDELVAYARVHAEGDALAVEWHELTGEEIAIVEGRLNHE